MTTISFKQSSPAHLFAPFFNILAFLTPLYFLIKLVIRVTQTANIAIGSAVLVFLVNVIIPAIFLLITANYFCEIAVEETGLSVTFLWSSLHLDWQEVVEIKAKGFVGGPSYWVVLTKKLTPFHRLYGVIYGFSWLPGFIISPSLSDGEKLVKMIEEHIRR